MPNAIRLKVGEELAKFSNEVRRSPKEFVESFSNVVWLIREPFSSRIKESKDLKRVLLELFDLAKLGWSIDKYVRDVLELDADALVIQDSDIDLGDSHYFFA